MGFSEIVAMFTGDTFHQRPRLGEHDPNRKNQPGPSCLTQTALALANRIGRILGAGHHTGYKNVMFNKFLNPVDAHYGHSLINSSSPIRISSSESALVSQPDGGNFVLI